MSDTTYRVTEVVGTSPESVQQAIRNGIAVLGKATDSLTIDDLAPIDEFHIGGRQASEHFLDQLDLTAEKTSSIFHSSNRMSETLITLMLWILR